MSNQIVHVDKESVGSPIHHKDEPKSRESLLLKRVLLKPQKESQDPIQRRSLFKTKCKSQGKCCKLIVDSGITDNIVATEMVEELYLKRIKHPSPYKVSWLQKGHQILVNEQAYVEFQIGSYRDNILCDVMPMDVCNVFFGRLQEFDRKEVHDRIKNTYTIPKDGEKHTLMPIKEKEEGRSSKVMMISGKEFLHDLKNKEI